MALSEGRNQPPCACALFFGFLASWRPDVTLAMALRVARTPSSTGDRKFIHIMAFWGYSGSPLKPERSCGKKNLLPERAPLHRGVAFNQSDQWCDVSTPKIKGLA